VKQRRLAPWYHNSVPGTLWIVATPIGTLGDMAPRAREVLCEVDLILAEDTRRARALLSHLEVPAGGRVKSLHEHNERSRVPGLVEALSEGRSLALISDAGTPVLSDPGYLLVREARRMGMEVRSVPGPSSLTAALAASGQPPLPATLCGFLPGKSGPRRRRIQELAACSWTLVLLLSPHRLAREIADLADGLGEGRQATLLAEISKLHERATMGSLGELAVGDEVDRPRGEYVLVVGPPVGPDPASAIRQEDLRSEYDRELADGADRREAMRTVARRFGLRRREVFTVLTGGAEPRDPDPEA